MMFGLILLVFIAYYMFGSSNSGGLRYMDHQFKTNTPQDILNERYARGEIQREEYLERKQGLLS